MKFVRNYLSMIIRAFPRPETWIFSFAYHLPDWFKWGFLLLFLLTPWIRKQTDPLQSLFLLLCLNLIGALLSMPVMEEIRTRLMMVTIPLHIMVFVLGLSNAIYFMLRIVPTQVKIGDRASATVSPSIKSDRQTLWWALLLMAMVIFGPVIFDRVRKIKKPDLPKGFFRPFKNENKIMVDMSYTPRILVDLDHDFRVMDPYIIPKSKFWSNMTDTSSRLYGRFYLANVISCVGNPKKRFEISPFVISERLISDPRLAMSRFILFRIHKGEFKQQNSDLYFADSVFWHGNLLLEHGD